MSWVCDEYFDNLRNCDDGSKQANGRHSSFNELSFFGYCLKKLGFGMVIALEHLRQHVEINRQFVALHGLESIVKIVYAPLVRHAIRGKHYDWYDISGLKIPSKIDLLFVDGPPGSTGIMARYPALPILKSHLSQKSAIWWDDGNRRDEKLIANKWLREFSNLKARFVATERGSLTFWLKAP